jgi:hypothetical protein
MSSESATFDRDQQAQVNFDKGTEKQLSGLIENHSEVSFRDIKKARVAARKMYNVDGPGISQAEIKDNTFKLQTINNSLDKVQAVVERKLSSQEPVVEEVSQNKESKNDSTESRDAERKAKQEYHRNREWTQEEIDSKAASDAAWEERRKKYDEMWAKQKEATPNIPKVRFTFYPKTNEMVDNLMLKLAKLKAEDAKKVQSQIVHKLYPPKLTICRVLKISHRNLNQKYFLKFSIQ